MVPLLTEYFPSSVHEIHIMIVLGRRWDKVQANFDFVCYALRYTFISWHTVNHGMVTEFRHVGTFEGAHVIHRKVRVSCRGV
jgi:hypothetical protein